MNPANPTQWVEEYEAKLADLKKKSEDLQENFAASSATVTSRDGAVTVTVGPNGGLQDLVLGRRAVELGAPRLTALILETARHAQKEAAQKVLEIFQPLGEGTEAYQMVADAIPADEETEEYDAYDETDETDAYDEPTPAPPVSGPAAARGRQPADDEDDDNQPW